ncbi:MAG: hypothetical protein M0Z75_06590 [Nitrospiraceae bacterium]|nr:hypothetical protein [Nitrospiraceae bacterium]MDA8091051.1 hypothetical protein [Nitrospiraceae bacterium]
MAQTKGKELLRIEDFINRAKEGKKMKLTVNLRKQLVFQKEHPELSQGMEMLPMYLYCADYTFRSADIEKVISKIYVYSSAEESFSESIIDKDIANDRLKLDYHRLRDAGIEFVEKYF